MATELHHLLPALTALADPTRRVDRAEVGELVGLSPSRAQRVMADATGETPNRFQRRTRLDLGAVLLAATDARIVDVAFATGFGSQPNRSTSIRTRRSASTGRRAAPGAVLT